MTYSDYKNQCKRLGYNHTMTQEQFNEVMGIDTEVPVPKLEIKPKQVKLKIKEGFEEEQPKKRKPLTAQQRKRKNERKSELRKIERRKNPNFLQRTDLSQMTPDEVKAHRAAQQRARMAKKKANGLVKPPPTAEDRRKRKEWYAVYYEKMKHDPVFMAKRAEYERQRKERRKANQ